MSLFYFVSTSILSYIVTAPEECHSRSLAESNSKVDAHHIEDGTVNYDAIDLPIISAPSDSADSARSSIPCISVPLCAPSTTPVDQAEAPTCPTLLVPRTGIATAVDAGLAVRPTPSSIAQTAELPASGIEPCANAESRPIVQTPAAPPTAQQLADAARILKQLQESMEEDQDELRSRSSSVDPWAIQIPHPLSRAPSPIPSPVPSRAASPLPAPASDHLEQTAAPKGRPSRSAKKGKAKPKKINPRKRAPASDDNPRPQKKGRLDMPDIPEMENTTPPARRSTRETAPSRAAAIPTPAAQRATKTLGAVSTTPSSPTTIECPHDAALWLVNAVSMLSAGDLGAEWLRLVQAWVKFELEQGSNAGSKLNSAQRPIAVAEWMKRKRSSTWRPLVGDVVAYGTMHMDWWHSLQPSWRLREDGTIDEEVVAGDWAELRKPGVNGILSVLASLFYWGVNVKGRKDAKGWSLAVCDCLYCLQYMA